MNKGLIISGLGHLGLILWALLGGWFTWTSETPPMQVAEVSLISTSEFDALLSAAPKVSDAAPTPAPQPATTEVPAPNPEAAPPEVATPEPPPPEVPAPEPALPEAVETPPAPDPEPAPEPLPVTPPAETPQPVPVPLSDTKPEPRPADRIASTPVDSTDQPDTADVPTPEQTDAPSPDAVPEPELPPAAPVETVTAVTPDAKPADEATPQLAPTTSPRPASRPRPVETPAEPPADDTTADAASDTPAADPSAAEQSVADQAAIDAALAAVTAPQTAPVATDSQSGAGGTGDQPLGAALNSGEIDSLRRVIGPLWNIGSLSTEAARVTVTMRVKFSQDQKVLSVELVEFTDGTQAAAQQAFEAAKRAVYRGAQLGLGLPPDKYDTWKSMLFTFDTSKGRLR